MSVKLVVKGHGIQHDATTPIPIPYDIKRDLLSGSDFDQKTMNFLVRCYVNKMAPVSGGNDLINWFDMSSSHLLTAVLAYTSVNANKNRQTGKLVPFKMITDQEVKQQLQQMIETEGFISPKQWEQRFPSLRISRK